MCSLISISGSVSSQSDLYICLWNRQHASFLRKCLRLGEPLVPGHICPLKLVRGVQAEKQQIRSCSSRTTISRVKKGILIHWNRENKKVLLIKGRS